MTMTIKVRVYRKYPYKKYGY